MSIEYTIYCNVINLLDSNLCQRINTKSDTILHSVVCIINSSLIIHNKYTFRQGQS